MRQIAITLAALLALTVPARAGMVEDCAQASGEVSISACTAVIDGVSTTHSTGQKMLQFASNIVSSSNFIMEFAHKPGR
jgi:hypothetical protein